MVRAAGGKRGLLRPGALDGRGARASAHARPRRLRRGGRREPGSPGAALLRDADRLASACDPGRGRHRRGAVRA
jgi:hypothetical protein